MKFNTQVFSTLSGWALALGMGISAQAQATVAPNLLQSSWSAREVFAQNYLAVTGQVLGTEFVGLSAQVDASSGEHVVRVWIGDSANSMIGQELRCSANCNLGAALPSQAYTHPQRRVTEALLKEAVQAAGDEFKRKIAPLEQLTNIKLWIRGAYVYYRMEWVKAGAGPQTSFLACHEHGAHIDCHRQTRAGAGEF
jgi:hypothetical protein